MTAATRTRRFSAARLSERPVRWNGIRLGVAVDLVLDDACSRVVGMEVRCENGELRFLPLPACEVRDTELAVTSAMALLAPDALPFYRERGQRLTELTGAAVVERGRSIGRLADLLLTGEGSVRTLVVEREGATHHFASKRTYAFRPAADRNDRLAGVRSSRSGNSFH